MKRTLAEATSVFVVALALFTVFLAHAQLPVDNDPLYADVIRSMARGGDWVNPSIHGVPFLDKPPLFFWLGAAAAALTTPIELAAHLPAAVSAALMLSLMVLAMRRAGDRWATVALALATLIGVSIFVEYGRRVYMELPVALCVLGALLAYDRACADREERRDRFWLLAGVLVGAGVMLKSLVGLFGVLPVLAQAVLERRFRLLVSRGLWLSALAAAAVAVPWHAVQLVEHRQTFLDFTWRLHVKDQILDAQPWSAGPPWFYLQALIVDEPVLGVAILIGLGLCVVRVARRQPLPRLDGLLALAVVLMLVVFSAASTKKTLYLIPLAAPAALLFARRVGEAVPRLAPIAAVAAVVVAVLRPIPFFQPGGAFLTGAASELPAARAAAAATAPGESIYLFDRYFSAIQYYADRPTISYWGSATLVDQTRRIPYIRYADDMRFVAPDGLTDLISSGQRGVWLLPIDVASTLSLGPRVRVLHQDTSWEVVDSR